MCISNVTEWEKEKKKKEKSQMVDGITCTAVVDNYVGMTAYD